MKKIFIILFIALVHVQCMAQDSLMTLSYSNFIEQVMSNHPYVYRAEIVQQVGEFQVKESRGAFDPVLFGTMDQKYFNDSKYYSKINGGLKIPTWFGLSAETGYTLNDGSYLNPENRVPNSGLWYAGLRLELGNGLIIDQRRAAFEKAKLYRTGSELERIVMLNQLKRDASMTFWNWKQAYQELHIYTQAYKNAMVRLDAVRESAVFGDRPYIDTVEAKMTVQNRNLALMKARTSFENAELQLEIYLWEQGFVPLELENTIPDTEEESQAMVSLVQLDTLISGHPYLQINDLKFKQRMIDLQLKREQLKPKVTLKYNAISEPINNDPLANYSPSNYTWGAKVSYPILTRKERSGVQMAELRLEDQKLNNEMVNAEIQYKVTSSLNNYLLALDQLEVTRQLVRNNEMMYEAEKELFGLGESSVFMINSRENSWIKSKIQLVYMEAQCQRQKQELLFQLMLEE